MTTEAVVGAIGIGSSLLGQAMFWAISKGRSEAKAERTEKDVAELKESRSEMWTEINSHGERLAKVETACRINHRQHLHGVIE